MCSISHIFNTFLLLDVQQGPWCHPTVQFVWLQEAEKLPQKAAKVKLQEGQALWHCRMISKLLLLYIWEEL